MNNEQPFTQAHAATAKLTRRNIEIISGLAAGFATTITTHPLDVIKVRLQLSHQTASGSSHKPFHSISSVLRRINHDAIVSSQRNHWSRPVNLMLEAYRGLVPNLVGNISAWGLYFTLYAEFKQHVHFASDTLTYFTSSTLAGLTTSVITNPIWVLKTRILGESRGEPGAYRSLADGVRKMLRREGVASFWKGAIPSMFQVFQASLQITIYDQLKNYHIRGKKKSQQLHSWQYLYISATSKIFSSLIMYPAQVVKSRLQNSHGDLSILQVVKNLYFNEGGYAAFYKGLSANILRVLPATCITFVTYESVKKYLTLHV
ncbi:uncharacterized protein LODBEIA_P59280 [Lodderomyces beijingensis]|uniref:Mitochondrial thiamine pyrophosphate carrier 1 n=1 Tax=Lodderomyces beijingensis TaxID=1775926 RepID=A0ABP0ZUW8_9ASCO